MYYCLLLVSSDRSSSISALTASHLSAGRRGVANFLGDFGEDGDEPALSVELIPQTPPHAAQQGGQQVLVTGAELTVLQVVLQKPDVHTHTSFTG